MTNGKDTSTLIVCIVIFGRVKQEIRYAEKEIESLIKYAEVSSVHFVRLSEVGIFSEHQKTSFAVSKVCKWLYESVLFHARELACSTSA